MTPRVKLEEIAEIKNGYAFSSRQYENDKIPLIRISNINHNLTIDFNSEITIKENPKYDDYIIKKNDILIALSGATTGKFGIFQHSTPAYLNQRLAIIRSHNLMSQKYIFYFLNIIKEEILRKAGGAAQPNISTKKLGEFLIPNPDISIQKSIVARLDRAEAVKQLSQQLLTKYDELAQSVFLEMFGDPVLNEKGWEVKIGEELFAFSSGKYKPTKTLNNEFEYPTYGGNGITGYSDEFLIDFETIVIGRVGAYCGSIHLTKEKSWITDNAIYIKENKKNFNLKFLYFFLKYYNLNRFADYSGQPKITQRPLKTMLVFDVPLSLQTEFARRIENIEHQKSLLRLEIAKSEELFESLLQESFSPL